MCDTTKPVPLSKRLFRKITLDVTPETYERLERLAALWSPRVDSTAVEVQAETLLVSAIRQEELQAGVEETLFAAPARARWDLKGGAQ